MTREETLRRFKSWTQRTLSNYCSDEDYHMANNIIALLEQEPKIGHWKSTTHYARPYRVCSVCDCERIDDHSTGWNYCPYCGAKMKGE